MARALTRFAQAIGYPADVPAEASDHVFLVDGGEIAASEADGRLRLVKDLCAAGDGGAVDLAALAGYAAGRLLKEEATLAWDAAREMPVLWQDVAASADDAQLRAFFEVFAASCDWWLARVQEGRDRGRVPELMIVP